MQRVYLFILVFDSTLVLTTHHVVYNVSPVGFFLRYDDEHMAVLRPAVAEIRNTEIPLESLGLIGPGCNSLARDVGDIAHGSQYVDVVVDVPLLCLRL